MHRQKKRNLIYEKCRKPYTTDIYHQTELLRSAATAVVLSSNRQKSTGYAYETVSKARKGISDYLCYFSEERSHERLDNRAPDEVFYKRKPGPI